MSGTEISILDVGMIDGLSQIHHKPSNKKKTPKHSILISNSLCRAILWYSTWSSRPHSESAS